MKIASGPFLFLDLARQCGWAEGEPGGEVAHGSVALAPQGAGQGAVFDGLDRWLRSRLAGDSYAVLAYEAPRDPRHMKQTTLGTARMLLGLCAIAEAAGARHRRITVQEHDVHAIRRFVLGRAATRGKGKDEVMWALRDAGFRPQDDNASDAIAGLLYTQERARPGCTARHLPLLRGAS